jgi:hypothetical protein
VLEDATSTAPFHPSLDRRSLIWSLGYRSGVPLRSLDRRVIGTVAQALPLAALDQRPIAQALADGFGVALPTESWRNQLPVDHPKRAGRFSQLKVHRSRQVYDPDRQPWRGSEAARYAADDQADQVEAGATLITTPGHVLELECAAGRQSEYQLATLAVEEFVAAQRSRPAPGRSGRRELYATIVVQGKHAAVPGFIDHLIRLYANLEGVSGYWIVAANSNRSAKQLRGYYRLGATLQDVTARCAALSRVGDGHLAALTEGLAATCVGLHTMTFEFPPHIFDEADEPKSDDGGEEEDGEEKGIGIYTYFPPILGNAGRLGPEGDALRLRLFGAYPCECGHHKAYLPPVGKGEIARHNAWAVAGDALELAGVSVSAGERKLVSRVDAARRHRSRFKMSPLGAGFAGIIREAQELRERRGVREVGEPLAHAT